ncbi:MAG: C10 family peptidase, partial [Bacteroidaceae bacterium]|nr:C10 family peptidase [Bacteroidaceae bacterium]
MKKILSLTASVLVATSAIADPIDAEKAKAYAQEYMIPGHTMTLVKKAARNEAKARGLNSKVASTSPYYIYSRGEGLGFVIVSGDDCLPTILGYTEQGDWNDETVPEALSEMLAYYADAIETAQLQGTNISVQNEAKQRRAESTKVDIAPLVSSHWHQSSPYNDNCPTITSSGAKALTGCVATAAAQILYYWRKDLPSTLQNTTPTYGYGDAPVTRSVPKGTPLKWDLMQDSYSGNEGSDYKEAVAEFVFATGAATWLTYGSSTSGNIEKIPYTYSAYFGMNGGTVHYRDSYSQSAWSNLLYNELINGRPVMYTGVHTESGGHAVFVHGYKASSDLFYFNFGWGAGNGYDGYYTTSQTDGMNGFNGSQSALIGAYPKTWNIDVNISTSEEIYAGATNDVKVTLENNSTLPVSGVYVFVSSSSSKPTKLTAAKDSDTKTYVASGESHVYDFNVPISGKGTYYITITDANLYVLAKKKVEAVLKDRELTLNSFEVNGASDKITYGGQDYSVVYNSKRATLLLNVTNNSDISYENSLRYTLYSKDLDATEWDEGTSKSSSVEIPANSTSDIVLTISSINTEKLYKAVFTKKSEYSTSYYSFDVAEDVDTVVYFTLKDGNLTVDSYVDGVIKCSGNWDYETFSSYTILNNSSYYDHTAIDLTQVKGVKALPENTINPNALYYVADDSEATGINVVKSGECTTLSLIPGYNFVPMSDFKAVSANITLGTESAKWYLLTIPFDANVPDG